MKYFVVYDKNLVVKKNRSDLQTEELKEIDSFSTKDDFFNDNAFAISVVSLSDVDFNKMETEFPDYEIIPLRQFFYENDENEVVLAARANGLVSWRKNHKFCSKCGKILSEHKTLTAMECSSCHEIVFPRIEPCVIVLVLNGEKILLAKHKNRNQDIYACISGFMETGESCEYAVKREVFEETGLNVKNIVYKGSQSWPFPYQLMLAFTAEYESGEVKVQEDELSDAKWFYRNECTQIPKPGSIAYKLINNLF